jgi:hypothetical protein
MVNFYLKDKDSYKKNVFIKTQKNKINEQRNGVLIEEMFFFPYSND